MISVSYIVFSDREEIEVLREHMTRMQSLAQGDAEYFLVDFSSRSEILGLLSQYIPRATYIAPLPKTGFAKAVNQAFTKATGEYIFFLLPHFAITSSLVEEVQAQFQGDDQLGYFLGALNDSAYHAVPYVCVRRAVRDGVSHKVVGNLDEQYVTSFALDDYRLLSALAGWEVRCHAKGLFNGLQEQSREEILSFHEQRLVRRDFRIYMRKYGDWGQWLVAWLLEPVRLIRTGTLYVILEGMIQLRNFLRSR